MATFSFLLNMLLSQSFVHWSTRKASLIRFSISKKCGVVLKIEFQLSLGDWIDLEIIACFNQIRIGFYAKHWFEFTAGFLLVATKLIKINSILIDFFEIIFVLLKNVWIWVKICQKRQNLIPFRLIFIFLSF